MLKLGYDQIQWKYRFLKIEEEHHKNGSNLVSNGNVLSITGP